MEELRIEEGCLIPNTPKNGPADDESAGFFIVDYALDRTIDFSVP